MWRLGLVLAAMLIIASPAAAKQDARAVVTFESDSDALTPAAVERITAFAREVRGLSDKSVKVEAHATLAESEGSSPEYAVGLSQRRANTVRSALVEAGVPPGEIVNRAFGSRRPLPGVAAASPTQRRVEISLGDGAGW